MEANTTMIHPPKASAPEMVRSIQTALDAGRPIWICTYTGAYGVREIKLANDKAARVKLGRSRSFVWLTHPQLVGAYAQSLEVR